MFKYGPIMESTIIFVVENKWAIGMAHDRATSNPEIWRKTSAFGMHGEEVDGMMY